MEAQFICKYCDHKWIKNIYEYSANLKYNCPKCGDKNLIIKELNKDKIDYYQGTPPFEEKPNNMNEKIDDGFWPYGNTD